MSSSKTTLTTDASYPKLSPAIVRISPPRKFISVFGVTEVTSTGIEMGSVISFCVSP